MSKVKVTGPQTGRNQFRPAASSSAEVQRPCGRATAHRVNALQLGVLGVMLRCRSPFRSLPSGPLHRTLTQMRCRTVAVHRRWYRSPWAPSTLAVESPTDLFVASHWLERSSCRFPVTLLVFSRADHSTSQVLTTSHVILSQLFTEGLLQKAPMSIRPLLIGSPAVTSHTEVNSDIRSIQISSQKFVYVTKQACKQLQCNKAKLLEPVSVKRSFT